MIRAIGFDFDGTLVQSESEKARIFEELFKERYSITAGVRERHAKLHGKAERREKFRRLILELLDREPGQQELEDLSKEFGKRYRESLSTCPLLGAVSLLKTLRSKVGMLFLLSLERREDVVAIATHCGFLHYFDEVLGGPASKEMNFRHLLEQHKLEPGEVLYIGDSPDDAAAAARAHVPFVAAGDEAALKRVVEEIDKSAHSATLGTMH